MADDNSKDDRTRGIIPFRFRKGVSGNPSGSVKGYRKALSGAFLRALAEDFEEHGAATIIAARQQDPLGYARIVAGLLPKEVEIANPLDDISDEELTALLAHLRANIRAAAVAAETEEAGTGGPH